MRYTVTQPEPLDWIIERHYGRMPGDIIGKVYEANQGLSKLGTEIPPGTTIELPDLPQAQLLPVQRLWGGG